MFEVFGFDVNTIYPWQRECDPEIPIAPDAEDCVLMQYTGLKDKNGKEIYEGDIVKLIADSCRGDKFKPFIAGYVSFRSGSFYITDNAVSRFRWEDYIVEVIGNIYENPELLD